MNKYFPQLFQPMTIRGVTFRNRILGAPNMNSWLTSDKRPDDNMISYYERKAKGGAAQVTIGGGMVDADICELGGGFFYPTHELLARMCELVRAIHRHGAVTSIELCHGGAFYPVDQFGRDPVAPSAFLREDGVQVEEITEERMNEIADHYASYAALMKTAGFDMVMLHGAHGWGLGQFLSPEFNRRTDQYGGSVENRARFPLMVIDRVRQAIGEDMLIEYRISGDECCEQGHHIEDTVAFCKLIDGKVDLIHVSAARDSTDEGAVITHPTIFLKNGCNVWMAEAVKRAGVKTPVAAIGGINTPELAEEVLAEGKADFIAMARTLMADPDFPNKARLGNKEDIIPCIRCLSCLTGLQETGSYNCSVNPRTGRERFVHPMPAAEKLRVVVVGGGAAGCQAAITAAERGHDVTLLEKTDRLGGILNFTDHDDLKIDLRRLKDYLIHRVGKLAIDVRFQTEAKPELVESLRPDAVIVAAGSHPMTPPIPGLTQFALHVLDVYQDLSRIGRRVIMIGGGLAGCETGVFLAEQGHKVEIIEKLPELAHDANWMSQQGMLVPIEQYGIGVHTSTTCLEVLPNRVRVADAAGAEHILEADTILYGLGMRSNASVYAALADSAPTVIAVGDAKRARKVAECMHEGYFAALDLA